MAVWAVLLLLALAPSVKASPAADELVSLSQQFKDRVLRLNDATYKSLAKTPEEPRDYFIAVFFDAVMFHDKRDLDLPGFRRDFAQVAKAYYDAVKENGDKGAPPLFFADIEFKQSEGAFQLEAVKSLPHIRIFGPGSDTKGVGIDMGRFAKTFSGIVDFLKDSGVDTNDMKPPPPLSTTQMLLLGVSIIVLSPFVAMYVLTRRTVLHDTRLWCLFGLCVYMFSVGGGMFNVIRNMPWYVPSREKPGQYMYFLQQQGNQFGVEGMVIGSLYSVVGLVLAFNVYVLPLARSDAVKRGVGMLSVLLCAFAVRKVVEFEVWKQGYWVHGFWPTSWR